MLKIAHIITRFLNAGADENTLYSCNWSAEHGDQVFLLIGKKHNKEIIKRLDPRVVLIIIPDLIRSLSLVKDIRALSQTIKALQEIKPDIVHTHTSKAGIVGRIAAKAVKVEAIVHGVHIAPFINVGRLQRFIFINAERLVTRWTDAFIHVSQGMHDAFSDENLGHPEKHYIVHSGMNVDDFRSPKKKEDWRDFVDCRADGTKPPIILMLAGLEKRKRHVELIKSFDAVLRADKTVQLVFAGDGIYRNTIEAAVARSFAPERIKLIGFHPNPAGLIGLADFCIHCSTREGLPRVIVQYIAAGVPVVMTNLPGIDEVIVDECNGVIVKENDFDALSQNTIELLQNSEKLNFLRQNAKSTDVSAWEIDNMCIKNQQIYNALLKKTA